MEDQNGTGAEQVRTVQLDGGPALLVCRAPELPREELTRRRREAEGALWEIFSPYEKGTS